MSELLVLINSFQHQTIVRGALLCLAVLVQQPYVPLRASFFDTAAMASVATSTMTTLATLPENSATSSVSMPITTLLSLLQLTHRSLVVPTLRIIKYARHDTGYVDMLKLYLNILLICTLSALQWFK